MPRTHMLVIVSTLAAIFVTSSAFAQTSRHSRLFRTLDEALASGLYEPVEETRPTGPVSSRGLSGLACAQPPDGVTGFNANFLSLAESRTFRKTGAINELGASFIVVDAVHNGCPEESTNPVFAAGWQVRVYDVLPDGDIDESSVTVFDTDLPLANMTATNTDGGIFQGFAPIVEMRFDLTNGGANAGVVVEAGDCLAVQLRPLQFGTGADITCSMFWESSTDPDDGSVTGDGFSIVDMTSMNSWTLCDYADSDLMLCMDYAFSAPPLCTPDFSTPPFNDECDSTLPLICSDSVNVPSITQCLRFATSNTSDPVLDGCLTTGGLDPNFTGLSTVWYEFLTAQNQQRLLIEFCSSLGSPNLILSVYQEGFPSGTGPCNLLQVACNDNGCGPSPYLYLEDVGPKEKYIISVAAVTPSDAVNAEMYILCEDAIPCTTPENDEFQNAEAIVFDTGGTGILSGTTRCANSEKTLFGGCNTPDGEFIPIDTSPGVWYSFIGDGTAWRFSQCAGGSGDYDTAISVFCLSCCDTFSTCVAAQDEGGNCDPLTELTLCTVKNAQYLLYIHGESDVGDFEFVVEKDIDRQGICEPTPIQTANCVNFVCLGDCDQDGIVNFSDLLQLLDVFGLGSFDTRACDTDRNGVIDFSDLVATLGFFGDCP